MTTEFTPLGDRILAKRVEAAETASGLFIPEVARERPQEALVVSVGPGKILDHYLTAEKPEGPTVNLIHAAPSVKPGDRILIGKYVGSEVSIDSQLFVILREEEVLGIIREKEVVPE